MSEKINANWFQNYFNLYKDPLFNGDVIEKLMILKNQLLKVNEKGSKAMIFGNGGSAAIASHVSVDFSKNANLRMINFNEADLITCLSNDYGFENWMAKAIEMYGDSEDQVLLISSSGQSPNVVNAAKFAKEKGLKVVTFTGFKENNPLKANGDLNFWVDSYAYNIVEMVHHIWLLSVCDSVIGSSEYSAN